MERNMVDPDAIKRLLERLQIGWAPQTHEIEPSVPQVDALNWQWNFENAGTIVPLGITCQTIDRQPRKTASVLYIDEHVRTFRGGNFLSVRLGRERESETHGRLIPHFLSSHSPKGKLIRVFHLAITAARYVHDHFSIRTAGWTSPERPSVH
jgi:hypothetical protein